MALSRKIWRLVTQPWTDREGNRYVRKELVAPGYYTRVDNDVEERAIAPIPVKGPFTLHHNGFGTLQISDGNNRLVTTVRFGDFMLEPKDVVAPEEALWLAQTIVDALNKAAEEKTETGTTL